MPRYLHPGVYVEEIPGGLKPIWAVETSITAFIGAVRSKRAVKAVQPVNSWFDYQYRYGGVRSSNDAMGFAVHGFFENGGRRAYICNPGHADVSSETYSDAVTQMLDLAGDASVIVMPGICWQDHDDGKEKIRSVLACCESLGSKMLIIDLPECELHNDADVQSLGLPVSKFAVVYYPWIKVTAQVKRRRVGRTNTVHSVMPASGHAAGIWARTDMTRGVWKAPAGLEAGLRGVAGLHQTVTNNEQGILNLCGINCLRQVSGAGPVIWGSRTLAGNSEWHYVPVQRMAMMIEQSIYKGISWAVFEPNNHQLWASLRANINSFMFGLFRAGAFQGATASEAYFVRCGLGDSMTQGDIDRGQLIVELGFAALKPAEFVILRIQQKVGQQ